MHPYVQDIFNTTMLQRYNGEMHEFYKTLSCPEIGLHINVNKSVCRQARNKDDTLKYDQLI